MENYSDDIVAGFVGAVSGVCYYIYNLDISTLFIVDSIWPYFVKIIESSLIAFCSGAAGVLGKQLIAAVRKFYLSRKNKRG